MAALQPLEPNRELGEETLLVNKEGQEPPEPAGWKVKSSMLALVGVAVLKTQITAGLLRALKYPAAFSMLSCVVTCVMLVPLFLLFPSQWRVVSWKMIMPDLLIIVVLTALDMGFANIALAELSTALTELIAACTPAVTAFLETLYLGKVQHWAVYVTICGLVLGAGSAMTGSMGAERYSTYGLIAAMIQVTCSACKYVLVHGTLKKHKGSLSSLSFLFWVDLFMIPIYVPWIAINGEFVALFIHEQLGVKDWTSIVFTSALGGLRALTQFVVLTFVTATSMSAVNIVTQILNILISLPIQHTPVTARLIIGICLSLGSSGGYYAFKNFPGAVQKVDMACPMCAGKREAPEIDSKVP